MDVREVGTDGRVGRVGGREGRVGGREGGVDVREVGTEGWEGGREVMAIMKSVHMAWNGCIKGNSSETG